MADNSLEERGRALENQFFEKQDQQKLAAMKDKLENQKTREELRKASGMSDDAVLDRLVALGLRANTIAALFLVPLITVAWADGQIQEHERSALLQGAHGKGLQQGSDGYNLLQGLAPKKPNGQLSPGWDPYSGGLRASLRKEKPGP